MQAQKYLDAYNSHDYQKALDICNKELAKNTNDLKVYLYKSLSYAQLAVHVNTRDANTLAAEKSLNTLQVILLKDKSLNFQNAYAGFVDTIFKLTWEAASYLYQKHDMWHAKRILSLINEMTLFPKALYLEGKMLLAEGDLLEGLRLYNTAAKTIYLKNADGIKPDPADMQIYTDLANGIYATHDLPSALVIMDRCVQLFDRDTAINAYLQFIASVNAHLTFSGTPEQYALLLAKTDSLENKSGFNAKPLRWAIISNSLEALVMRDSICTADAYVTAIVCEGNPSLTDSVCHWLAEAMVQNTSVAISYGKPQVKTKPCYTDLVLVLENCNNTVLPYFQNTIEQAIANERFAYATYLLYNLLAR
ncbi:MAG: hypothetical protein ACK4IY_10035, partial [Chitinophagales bacterium]